MDTHFCMNTRRSTSARVKVQAFKVLFWSLEFERRSDISLVRYESILDLISKSPSTSILFMRRSPENIQNPFRCSKIPQIGLYWCSSEGRQHLKYPHTIKHGGANAIIQDIMWGKNKWCFSPIRCKIKTRTQRRNSQTDCILNKAHHLEYTYCTRER